MNNTLVKAVRKTIGHEILTISSMSNLLTLNLFKSSLGNYSSSLVSQIISDSDSSQLSKNGKYNFFKFFPAGASFQSINHFRQLSIHGEFKKYDYESEELNLKAYGQTEPPHYEVKKINGFKISLICGSGDLLASPPDYYWLYDVLEQ